MMTMIVILKIVVHLKLTLCVLNVQDVFIEKHVIVIGTGLLCNAMCVAKNV